MKYKSRIFISALALTIAAAFMFTQAVHADYGLGKTASTAGLSNNADVPGIIGNVVGAGLSLVTVLFFILMIYGGIRWMLARGKEDEAKKALDTIIAAIIGIIIVLSAYAITNFVFSSVGTQPAPSTNPTTPTTPTNPTTPNNPTGGDANPGPTAAAGLCNVGANIIDFCSLNDDSETECNDVEDCQYSTGACLPKLNCNQWDNNKTECDKQPASCTWVAS